MAIQISDVQVKLSGGDTNSDPITSLGGIISTHVDSEVISQLAATPTLVTGVQIVNAYSNALGDGTLKWDQDTTRLLWAPFGGVGLDGVVVDTAPATYVLGTPGGYIVVFVNSLAGLPTSTIQDIDITISNNVSNVFDSVSALESTDGLVEYRCMYIKNTHATDTAFDVRLWIKQQPTGPDDLAIALDPAGVGNGSTTGVAIGPLQSGGGGTAEEDGTGLLSGITWSTVSTQADGLLLGNMTPGQSYAFWEKRNVPAGTTQQTPNDTSKIGISALI